MSKKLPPADIKWWIFNRCFEDIWQRKMGFEASQHHLSIPGIRIWTHMTSSTEGRNQDFSYLKSAGGQISHISTNLCWIDLSNLSILRRRVLRTMWQRQTNKETNTFEIESALLSALPACTGINFYGDFGCLEILSILYPKQIFWRQRIKLHPGEVLQINSDDFLRIWKNDKIIAPGRHKMMNFQYMLRGYLTKEDRFRSLTASPFDSWHQNLNIYDKFDRRPKSRFFIS